MKKLLLATAIATVAVAAQAGNTYVVTSGSLPAALQYSTPGGVVDLLASPCVSTTNPPTLAVGGTVTDANSDGVVDSTNLTLTGQVEFDASCGGGSPVVRLDFSLTDGTYGATGVTYNDGTVQVEVQTTSGWYPYATVDASVTPLPFVSGVTGLCGTTAGVVFPTLSVGVVNVVPLPGTGCPANVGVSSITVLGTAAELQLGGNLTLTP